jgi:hypothetical protein
MKKAVIFVLVLFVVANSVLFSQEKIWEEGWMAMGANFGNYFQNDENLGNFYAGSLGVNFSGYAFGDNKKNIGIFFNYGILLPYQNPLAANTIENNFNQVVSADFLMGPGFKYEITDKLKLHYGFGINFNIFNFLNRENDAVKSRDQRFGFGIGGDIGLKFDITDIVYFNFGTALNYNFVNYRTAESTADNWTNTRQDSSGWIRDPMFGIRPYFAIGINFYSEAVKSKWGKPKIMN